MTETTPQYPSLHEISFKFLKGVFPSIYLTKGDTIGNIQARRKSGLSHRRVYDQIVVEGLTFLLANAILYNFPIFTPLGGENTDKMIRQAFGDCIKNSIANQEADSRAKGLNPYDNPTIQKMKSYSEMLLTPVQLFPLSCRL